jgi:predicted nucleic acid-binding protein
VRGLWVDAERIFTAAVAAVEARAAVARRLSGRSAVIARSELATRWLELEIIPLDSALLVAAGRAAERHRLHALDALHLAAAERVLDSQLIFAAWDAELTQAAKASGFATAPA